MKISFLLIVLCVVVVNAQTRRRRRRTPAPTDPPIPENELLAYLKKEVSHLKGQLTAVSRQLMLQQFFTEEKIRNDGFSGIKQVRTEKGK